jgi:hypothetical protein
MKTFICPNCRSTVSQDRLVDSDGKAAWWYQCVNPECKRCYGFPIYEQHLEFLGTLEIMDPGLEPWREEQPLKLTVARQALQITAGEVKRYIKEGAFAALIALGLILAVLAPMVGYAPRFTGGWS